MEPKIVTELPKELFKKPKLNNYSAVAGTFKPVFSKRNARKQSISQGYQNAQTSGNLDDLLHRQIQNVELVDSQNECDSIYLMHNLSQKQLVQLNS